jgi:hypothetical protein
VLKCHCTGGGGNERGGVDSTRHVDMVLSLSLSLSLSLLPLPLSLSSLDVWLRVHFVVVVMLVRRGAS